MLNTRNFSAALESHDFIKAAAIYEKYAGSTYFIKTADGKIIENIEQMITDYAGGRISIEDVREQLEDYRQFSGLQDEFAAYAEQVSRLEYSKSAYLSGLTCFEQGNYLQGLSDWTLVVPDDCYYQNVTNSISQNEKVYKTQGLLQCEKYKEYANSLYELRKLKGIDYNKAKQLIKDPVYFGMMMLKQGDCDGLVSGAIHSTADTPD